MLAENQLVAIRLSQPDRPSYIQRTESCEDEVAAEYTNGVLTLTLPKSEAVVKKINVKG